MEVTGKITKVLPIESGKSKEGKEWQKLSYIVETDEKYNNLYCLEVFGAEQVENFNKSNKVGNDVKVQFNVKTNEYKGKYYTSLQSWRIEKAESLDTNQHFETVGDVGEPEDMDLLPF